jgi:hypothetical protein
MLLATLAFRQVLARNDQCCGLCLVVNSQIPTISIVSNLSTPALIYVQERKPKPGPHLSENRALV